VANSPVPV